MEKHYPGIPPGWDKWPFQGGMLPYMFSPGLYKGTQIPERGMSDAIENSFTWWSDTFRVTNVTGGTHGPSPIAINK